MAIVSRTAWQMVALAALAQNCALGLTFGSFGALMQRFESEFDASRGMVSTALGVMVLTLSLVSIPLGARLGRLGLRRVMVTGALLNSVGFLLLTQVADMTMAILIYGLIIGLGSCLLGTLPASTLVSNWFPEKRGVALGIVNAPLFLFVIPPITARLLTHVGMDGVFLILSGAFLLCALMVMRVVAGPPVQDVSEHASVTPSTPPLSSGRILASAPFWLLSLGVGIVAGGGTMFTAHIVPLAGTRGFDLQTSSWLLSSYAGAGLPGVLFFGWLIDRYGARAMLVINALVQLLLWAMLASAENYQLLILVSACIGVCNTSILALHTAAINEIFGTANVGAVFGLSYVPKIIFIFGSVPLAGFLFDATDSYRLGLMVHIAGFAIATLCFAFLLFHGGRPVVSRWARNAP